MPPPPPPPPSRGPAKPYFFYGHRKPTQNRPAVRGGLFSNRQTLNPRKAGRPTATSGEPFDLQRWDPDEKRIQNPPFGRLDPSEKFFALAKNLSPIARYIVDAFRKHKQWRPELVEELNRLRRVTPKLVAEVMKFPDIDPRISSRFFHWAGKQKGYRHDFACYNAYAYFLNRANHFRDADQVPELMHMQGKPPSEKQFEILIRMHADANRGLRIHYVYEKMKKFGVKPSVFLFNRIMDALVKTDHLDLALMVYDDFKEDGLVEVNVTYMILIKGLCKAGRLDEVFFLLDRMRKNLCKPDVFAYTAMIKVLVSNGNLDGCLKVWDEMKKDGVEPDVMAYSTLFMALCKCGRVEKASELLHEMKEGKILIDRAIYGSLIEAYVEDGKVGSACGLLKELMDSGYRADLAIYNSLIKGLCGSNLVDRAYKLFLATIREDLQPDFHTVNPMLLSYVESKRMKDFHKLLEHMQMLGFSVADVLLEFLSSMVEKKDRVSMALEAFEYLRMHKLLTISLYNVLMEALFKIGKEKKALELFDELGDYSLVPDTSSYCNAILCYVGVGNLPEACKCYNKIIEMSSVPSIDAYYSLVKGLSCFGEVDAAMMLIRDCLANVTNGPMEFKYALTIIHVCKLNDARKVVDVANEMAEQDCLPNSIVYAAVIYGMGKHGTIEEARKFFSAMRESRFMTEADVVVFDDMLIDHMKKTTADLVLSGIKFFGLESKLKAKGSMLLSG
ncbi:pentatricopeptide repeat-containing protein At4g20740 [Andrographis paniculata]|uniref:pentatricopeptide repeat-containing protein At4g20740 n=1 Tax=Andrographis paniculata TaxID=175694 RepID=UPI0021E74535|nr:pentatricopeptide repeat-containing protein At4g20740 [Andrographis paniculata]XP_051124286.1 pentatricopeptide repeat-containing protein At4g20740 [Andrographis paniculata]XP_051124287.1 pentatricopeptide repeat-containing protein At4g20740 [Andrographis paniculata]XP_051124288.1 pentatricopeptide repeat-containing protein At4g20740 [Andrographis paniculata]XP_051124289.1 pentatricopeptide repeat-containing protein At4g20740 [Andrographis paniculata]